MKMLQEEENMEQLAIFGGKPVREKKISTDGNILIRQM